MDDDYLESLIYLSPEAEIYALLIVLREIGKSDWRVSEYAIERIQFLYKSNSK